MPLVKFKKIFKQSITLQLPLITTATNWLIQCLITGLSLKLLRLTWHDCYGWRCLPIGTLVLHYTHIVIWLLQVITLLLPLVKNLLEWRHWILKHLYYLGARSSLVCKESPLSILAWQTPVTTLALAFWPTLTFHFRCTIWSLSMASIESPGGTSLGSEVRSLV